MATPGDDLSGPDVVGVDLAEATATAEAQDPGAGPPGPQAEKVSSPPRVEQSDTIETTGTRTLVQPVAQTHTRVPEAHSLTLVSSPFSVMYATKKISSPLSHRAIRVGYDERTPMIDFDFLV